jgi:hypothetical protein
MTVASIRPCPLDALVRPVDAAEEIAAADHNADLHAELRGRGDVMRNALDRRLIEPMGQPPHQRLAGEFYDDAGVEGLHRVPGRRANRGRATLVQISQGRTPDLGAAMRIFAPGYSLNRSECVPVATTCISVSDSR